MSGSLLDVLGVTDDWYWGCNMMLSLVIANGEQGERWENPRAVAACRDQVEIRLKSDERGDLLILNIRRTDTYAIF
jgi:hypothetical protein